MASIAPSSSSSRSSPSSSQKLPLDLDPTVHSQPADKAIGLADMSYQVPGVAPSPYVNQAAYEQNLLEARALATVANLNRDLNKTPVGPDRFARDHNLYTVLEERNKYMTDTKRSALHGTGSDPTIPPGLGHPNRENLHLIKKYTAAANPNPCSTSRSQYTVQDLGFHPRHSLSSLPVNPYALSSSDFVSMFGFLRDSSSEPRWLHSSCYARYASELEFPPLFASYPEDPYITQASIPVQLRNRSAPGSSLPSRLASAPAYNAQQAGRSVANTLDQKVDQAKDAAVDLKDDLKYQARDVANNLVQKADQAKDAAVNLKDDIKYQARQTAHEAKKGIQSLAPEPSLWDQISSMWNGSDAQAAVGQAKDSAVNLKDDIKYQARQTASTMDKMVGQAKDSAVNLKDDIKYQARQTARDAKKGIENLAPEPSLWDRISSMWSKSEAEVAIDQAKDTAASLKDQARQTAQDFKKGIENLNAEPTLRERVSNLAGDIKDKTNSLIHAPNVIDRIEEMVYEYRDPAYHGKNEEYIPAVTYRGDIRGIELGQIDLTFFGN